MKTKMRYFQQKQGKTKNIMQNQTKALLQSKPWQNKLNLPRQIKTKQCK